MVAHFENAEKIRYLKSKKRKNSDFEKVISEVFPWNRNDMGLMSTKDICAIKKVF